LELPDSLSFPFIKGGLERLVLTFFRGSFSPFGKGGRGILKGEPIKKSAL
jgi:hypothetical protein